MKSIKHILCLGSVALFMSCAHVIPHFTSMDFNPDSMEAIGIARGSDSATFLFCLIPTFGGKASAITAVDNALQQISKEVEQSDALVNITADDETEIGLFGLWCSQTIEVQGLAVRFKSPPKRRSKRQEQKPGLPKAGKEKKRPSYLK